MSFSVSAQGTRHDVRTAINHGVPDSAITRAADSLMALFPADSGLSVSASGHLNPNGSGNVSVSVSASAPVLAVPEPVAAPAVPPPSAPEPVAEPASEPASEKPAARRTRTAE